MVIQKLVDCYQTLQANGCTVAPLGWNLQPISYAIDIDLDGMLLGLTDLRTVFTDEKGKNQYKPTYYMLPSHEQARSSNDKSYFLWDNGSYLFAAKAKRPLRRNHHIQVQREILSEADFPEALALLQFFERYTDEELQQYLKHHQIPLNAAESLNFVYSVQGKICGLQESFQQVWNTFFAAWLETQPKGIDIVTNQEAPLCNTHMPIKPCANLANGVALSFTNYGSVYYYKEKQGMVAPMGYHTVKAYTQAASYMAKHPEYHVDIGNLKLLFWTEHMRKTETDLLTALLRPSFDQQDLSHIIQDLAHGRHIDHCKVDPTEPVYLLGISTDISGKTISVAFFEQSVFGTLFQNVKTHYQRLQIKGKVKNKEGNWEPGIVYPTSLLKLRNAIAREPIFSWNKESEFHNTFIQKLLSSILFGRPYPMELMVTCQKRASLKPITAQQASILKAYYLQTFSDQDIRKECCTMGLNPDSTSTAYQLGRLFAYYEQIQWQASGNTNLHERYFRSAMTTPRQIFPLLSQMTAIYEKKLSTGSRIYLNQQLQSIKAKLSAYPIHLSLTEQGLFDLGYYHQRETLFTKKDLIEGETTNA